MRLHPVVVDIIKRVAEKLVLNEAKEEIQDKVANLQSYIDEVNPEHPGAVIKILVATHHSDLLGG